MLTKSTVDQFIICYSHALIYLCMYINQRYNYCIHFVPTVLASVFKVTVFNTCTFYVSCFYIMAEQSHPKPGQGSQKNIRNERGMCNTLL